MSVELVSMTKQEPSTGNGDVKVDTGDAIDSNDLQVITNNVASHKVEVVDPGESKEAPGEESAAPIQTVGALALFKFAYPIDRALLVVGSLFAIVHGGAMPFLFVIFGQVADTFVQAEKFDSFLVYYNVTELRGAALANKTYFRSLIESLNATRCYSVENLSPPSITSEMGNFVVYYIGLAFFVIVCGYFENAFWSLAAERQTRRMRLEFARSVMRQEIGWFDSIEAGALNSRLVDDIAKISDGIGEKIGICFEYGARFIVGMSVAFYFGWELSLIIMSMSPALMIAIAFMGRIIRRMTVGELQAYAKAGAIAEEVLSSIRTVMAFGGEMKECDRYEKNLIFAKKAGIKKGLTRGVGMGVFNVVLFCQYALGFWYGSRLTYLQCENYTAGTMFTVFTSILIASMSLGAVAPTIADFATARGAAFEVFKIIDRKPEIDSNSEEGKKPEKVEGVIEFRHVSFAYPTRPEVQVMRDFNLKISPGKTLALVGPSGCGKSTTVQLLQRFYDPLSGEVLIDDNNVRDLNIQWLRAHIGIVSQEPILFETTIEENIRFGNPGVTDEQIMEAAKMANAHDFVSGLPKKYKTLVGERGAHLSGGQKQRIAIARALVRDPKILLLDEATSALDTESEAVVQAALDKARMGRTTIVIAHRLSTVRTADVIVGIENGEVKEAGTHSELMAKEGLYYQLVTSQTDSSENDDNETISVAEFKKIVTLNNSNRAETPASQNSFHRRSTRVGSVNRPSHVQPRKSFLEEEEVLPEASFFRVIKYNAKEWPFIVFGCISAVGSGAIMPAFAVIYASVIKVFVVADPVEKEATSLIIAILFLVVGFAGAIATFLQNFLFTISGERLTERLRGLAFKSILRQEIGWFDDHRNSTGTLTTRLATDASSVQGASGSQIGIFLQNCTGMGVAVVIGFFFSWRLALVAMGFVPFMALSMFFRMSMMTRSAQKDKKAMEGAGKAFLEASVNIRTVASLGLEKHFISEFTSRLDKPHKENMRKLHFFGLAYGFTQSNMFFAQAAIFSYGAYLVSLSATDPDINIKFEDVMKVFSCIIFGAMGLGRASSFAADYGKAKAAAARMFQLFDRVPEIDNFNKEGECPESYTASLEFRDVRFVYPTRPEVKVLRGLNISVNPGETLALVGSSGCGKSTTVQLLERFYDPLEGHVMLDNRDIQSLNLSWLRQQIGLVLQEPILFDRTIRENIEYGDNEREVSMDEVIEAARRANIHNFIESLPLGYETRVGDKGTQLSGGQKQRVAIARALLRNPKVLLLDEATSALDTESEKIVQEALDKARAGRTSIVIAHRLSTIQSADKIAVIFNGQVVEQGTHQSLMKAEGFYHSLQTVQEGSHEKLDGPTSEL